MTDKDILISDLNDISEILNNNGYGGWCKTIRKAIALLKEQEDLGTELTNAVELIHKKNERIEKLLKEQEAHKFFVDESGKITPLPVVVRCRDCKHRPIKPNDFENGFDLEFPDNKCPCQNGDDGWYSWYPADNWYCAEGERRVIT